MKRLRDRFSVFDRIRYVLWRILGSPGAIRVRVQGGPIIWVRAPQTTDPGTAREIYLDGAYLFPHQLANFRPRLIVDLGANVGFSAAYWLHTFPEASIVAFEPHPVHLAQLRRHLSSNNGLERCRIIPAAACSKDGSLYLSDSGSASAISPQAGAGKIAVTARDFFQEVSKLTIDLLKMDIEGGEYELLSDERFRQLNVRAVVVEWHRQPDRPDGKQWCADRLAELGYSVVLGALDRTESGLLWGWKPKEVGTPDVVAEFRP